MSKKHTIVVGLLQEMVMHLFGILNRIIFTLRHLVSENNSCNLRCSRKLVLLKEYYGQPPVIDYTHEILDYTDVSANLKPSGEFPMHFGLQKQISTPVRVVLHMHPTYTVAAMYKGINLQDLLNEFPELSRYTSIAPSVPKIEPITQELADATLKNLEVYEGRVKYDIVGYDRHGVVAVDTSPWRAFEHIERLEHICKIVLSAR
jgi:ribulose-5-phosphate 4-epimerase/fuculose-1-phosphate aldolase